MGMLQYDFMQRAFAAGGIVALVCPMIGLFLVLKRLSLVGDTLAHVSMAGVAAGLLTGFNAMLGALFFTVAAAMSIEYLRRMYQRYAELAIAIMLSAGVSLAVILIGFGSGDLSQLTAYLFGSIVAITLMDVKMIALLGLVVIILVVLLYKELFFLTYDEQGAKLAGIPANAVNFIFMAVTAATVTITMRVVGVLLISSLMVIPAAASVQVAKSFRQAVILAVVFGEVAMAVGLTASYYLAAAPGGTVIMTAVLMLIIVLLFKSGRAKLTTGAVGRDEVG
ncbi:metal ABC transporter permease [Metallumcola ferriviriculae]|uniref:Metal ABC transporter permease n=1 Tax=Metallumcola ferriviriculae TaxID=3039180 RepID=A0AAU0UMJ0_9FIRM|nr:metal ABC transporter permease [Desulfitibacteraceae bacterium MK1]